MVSIEILVICLFTIAMAFLSLEADRIINGIIFLAFSSVGVGTIFFLVGATYAGILEFLLYAGVHIILFIAAASLTEIGEKKFDDEII